MSDTENKKSFHEEVAEKLIEQLKRGVAPWQRPWAAGQGADGLPMNPTTGNRYKGMNTVVLMMQGRDDPRWMTYNQAKAAGAQVRRGEKGTTCQKWIFSQEQTKLDDAGKPVLDANGKPEKVTVMLERPILSLFKVFNAEQIDGLPALEPKTLDWDPIQRAESVLAASGARIYHDGKDRAYYSPVSDDIHLPKREQFPTAANYYATALHELGHWTGHESRLGRDLSNPFGSEGYAKEELRAEIASMILGRELGIGHDPDQHAAYVAGWINVLNDDPLEIFRAAVDAEKAYAHVLSLENQQIQEASQAATVAAPGRDIPEQAAISAAETPSLNMNMRDDAMLAQGGPERDQPVQAPQETARLTTPATALAQNNPVPRDWQGEACRQFDEEMEKSVGQPYWKAQELFSNMRQAKERIEDIHWDGRTPTAAEAAEADKLQSGIDEAEEWLRENVYLNPAVKERMFPIVRDRSIDLKDDDLAFLAEMDARAQAPQAVDQDKRDGLTKPAGENLYLNVPFKEKDEAKELGARWDRSKRSWYVPAGVDVAPFAKWQGGGAAGQGQASVSAATAPAAAAPIQSLEPQQLSLADFRQAATAVKLDDHGQNWQIDYEGRSLGFSGAETADDAIADMHRLQVNNALYLNSPDSPLDNPPPLPTAAVMAEYPDLAQKFPQAAELVPSPNKDEIGSPPAAERQYLAVPYGERAAAKAAGARWDQAAKSWYAGPGADADKIERWRIDPAKAEQAPAMDPVAEFSDALRSIGCDPDRFLEKGQRHPIMDGKKHRIALATDKGTEKNGVYFGFLDGVKPAGYAKNHRTGVDIKWKAKGYSLTPEQQAQLRAQAAETYARREAEQQQAHAAAQDRVNGQIARAKPVERPTPYLVAKGCTEVKAGLFTDAAGKDTFIPAYDADGNVWTMQYINEEGTKRFAKDSKKEGAFHVVGGLDALKDAPAIVISEGYATAWTVSEGVGHATVAAFDSGNLEHVAKALQAKYPEKPVVIAGDDDLATERKEGINPGREGARKAANAVGGKTVFPVFAPGEQSPDNKLFTDFNDLATRSKLGMDAVRRQVKAVVEEAVRQHRMADGVDDATQAVSVSTVAAAQAQRTEQASLEQQLVSQAQGQQARKGVSQEALRAKQAGASEMSQQLDRKEDREAAALGARPQEDDTKQQRTPGRGQRQSRAMSR